MKNIAVVGVGYVGLVTGTCLADLGHRVVCLDVNAERVENLKKAIMPIYEPGLEEIVRRNVNAGRLSFTTSYADAINGTSPEAAAEFVFIAVGTPSAVDGKADLDYVQQAAESIADVMDHPLIVVNKSTVPVGTGDWTADIIRSKQKRSVKFNVVSNPEFLREGSAIYDFMQPDRIVLGSLERDAAEKVAQLYLPLRATLMITDLRTAEMIKYASNAFLATKISFINEIANICEELGADVKEVATGMGFDKRIGRAFLDAGVGYGGSCFEGSETIFTLNSPNIAAEKLETMFETAGDPFQGESVQVVTPTDKRVLAFELETGRPTLANITAITRRPYAGTMVNLITSMGRSLRVTADHPVIINSTSGFEILPAASVAPGDQLMALCELPGVEAPHDLNLIELLRGTELENDVYVSPIDQSFSEQYDRFAAHVPSDFLQYPNEIKRHNRMSLSLFRHLRESGALQISDEKLQLYTAKGAATKINAVIAIDADFMRLCGYYLAEGYISHDTGRAGAVRGRVGFSFNENEKEYIDDTQRILACWGLKFIERNSTHALTTIVSSRIFVWLLRDVLKCGTRSNDKSLPRLAFNVSADLRHELLRGAFSGDGAVTPVQDGKNLMLEYATVSKALADGLTLLLQTLGIVPSIRIRWMNKSTQVAYILRVSGYAQLEMLQNVFGDKRRDQIVTVLAGYQRHIKQRGFSRLGTYAALTVQAVEYQEVETTVYSLETSTGTVIASSGLICHNCFPKDVLALAHMAKERGRHPQLLQAVMDINADQRNHIVSKVRELVGGSVKGKKIGVLGLAFKPNTDDMRDAPAIDIINALESEGASILAYDPVAMSVAKQMMPNLKTVDNPYDAAAGCDALILLTEWNEFKQLDFYKLKTAMKSPALIDARNVYEPDKMAQAGFNYRGVGRGYNNK
jgi:UDPglucose 6-dehydrogenase